MRMTVFVMRWLMFPCRKSWKELLKNACRVARMIYELVIKLLIFK